MKTIKQVGLAILIISIMIGPLGHFLALRNLSPDLAVLVCWAYAWFGDKYDGYRMALLIGLPLDLIFFLPVGVWLGSLLLVVSLIVYLKTRLMNVFSMFHALLSLIISTMFVVIIFGALNHTFSPLILLNTVGLNILIGLIIFSIVGTRIRLFQRWAGRRI